MLNYRSLFTAIRVLLHLHRVKLRVDRVQVENRLTFTTVVVPLKPLARIKIAAA